MLSAAGTVIDLDSVVTKLTAISLAVGLLTIAWRALLTKLREIAGHTQQLTPNHGSHVADKVTEVANEVSGLKDWMRRMEDSDAEHSRQIRQNAAELAKLDGRFEQHLRESHS